MAVADKPVVQFSLAQIRKDAKTVDVLKVALSGSKIITFPDLMALESEESERKLARIDARGTNTWKALEDWLSKEDVEALRAEKLTRADLVRLLKNASKYYEDQYGDLGNDFASVSF